ncbi:MAG: tetratricopeptide repeat protein [Verrucomicrobium sp.]|nr:tetratricopeptide repeat protein [Verrucomicrobium sp.]
MRSRLLAALLLPVLAALPLFAQTAAPTDTPSPEFQKKMQAVFDAFSNGRYAESLLRLQEAEKLRPNDPQVINLHGSILVKQEQWAAADEQFDKALKIDPKFFPARFNKAEVLYLQKKYPESRAGFQSILADDPKNELILYKVYLTYLLEKNLDEAKARLDKFDFGGNTPAYYYANAAWLFNQGKGPQAEDYIRSALSIFPTQSNNLFAEPLIEAGWLQKRDPASGQR